mgnify:CR=1 FL=1
MGSDDTSDRPWRVRGIRGATTVPHNTPDEIRLATHELLDEMVRRNAIERDDVASAYFTTTPDRFRKILREFSYNLQICRM